MIIYIYVVQMKMDEHDRAENGTNIRLAIALGSKHRTERYKRRVWDSIAARRWANMPVG